MYLPLRLVTISFCGTADSPRSVWFECDEFVAEWYPFLSDPQWTLHISLVDSDSYKYCAHTSVRHSPFSSSDLSSRQFNTLLLINPSIDINVHESHSSSTLRYIHYQAVRREHSQIPLGHSISGYYIPSSCNTIAAIPLDTNTKLSFDQSCSDTRILPRA
jgi:hypothetical protein